MVKPTQNLISVIVLVSFLPTVASDSGDDFSNNLFSDLAPLLALFGERVAQQFMGQSMGWVHNIIFAMAPLGIITAIVGAIRVGGPGWLKSVIGRAREAYAVPELELLSSTSSDVCELWNGVALVKVLGSPTIIELVYLPKHSFNDVDDTGIGDVPKYCNPRKNTTRRSSSLEFLRHLRISRIVDAVKLRIWGRGSKVFQPDLEKPPTTSDTRPNKHHLPTHKPPHKDGNQSLTKPSAPNISLNIAKPTSRMLLWAVASIGVVLQSSVLLFDGITVYYPSWKSHSQFLKNGRTPAAYAFPTTAIGTLLIVAGMLICAYVVEDATEESEFEMKTGDRPCNMRLMWLQKHGKVGDQLFDSYVIFARGVRTSIWTSRRRQPWLHYENQRSESPQPPESQPLKHSPSRLKAFSRPGRSDVFCTLATLGTITSVVGFTTQFIGLRSMPWTATIAQLIATGVMTCLRALVCTAGLSEEPDTCKLPEGYELDWLATRLGDFQDNDLYHQLPETRKGPGFWTQVSWKWHVVTGRYLPLMAASWPELRQLNCGRANAVVAARIQLQKLTGWTREGSMAVSVVKAIEGVMNNLFSSDDITLKEPDICSFSWPMFIGFDGTEPPTEEPYLFSLKRLSKKDPWRMEDHTAVEAILSLWRFSLQQKESDLIRRRHSAEQPEDLQSETISAPKLEDDGEPKDEVIYRLLGPSNSVSRRDYRLWVHQRTKFTILKPKDLRYGPLAIGFTADPSLSYSDKSGYRTPGEDLDQEPYEILCVSAPSSSLEKICAQDLFSTFMWYVVGNINSLVSKTLLATDSLRAPPSPRNPFLDSILKAVEKAELGTSEEICMSIIPPLRSSGVLESMDLSPRNFVDRVNERVSVFVSRQDWEEAVKARYWLYDTCLESLQEDLSSFYRAAILLADFSASINDAATISERKAGSNGKYTQQQSILLDLSLNALKKVRSGKHGEEVVRILEAAYETVGNIKSLPKLPVDTVPDRESPPVRYSVTDKQPAIHDLIRGLLNTNVKGKKGDPNEQNILGWTPLHCATATMAPTDTGAETLLQGTTDKDVKDRDGRTPLHWAVLSGNIPWVEALLRVGSDKNSKDKNGRTPLHLAIWKGQSSVVQILLSEGADPDAMIDSIDFPLHWAVLNGKRQLVETLLKAGADKDIKDQSENSRTPLFLAFVKGHKDIATVLLENGADTESRDASGWTVLHWAILKGSPDDAEMLIKTKSVDIDATDPKGRTPLLLAISMRRISLAKMLLEKGADPDVLPDNGECALYPAAAGGDLEVVELLLNHGANPSLPTPYDWTPLHWAAGNGHKEVVKLLLEKRANPRARSDTGKTPLDMVRNADMRDIFDPYLN